MHTLPSRFCCLSLYAAFLLSAAGCASMNMTAPGTFQRTYVAEPYAVRTAVVEAIRAMGLSMTDLGKTGASTYHVVAYQMSRPSEGTGGRPVRMVNIDIYIEAVSPDQTRVRLKTRAETVAYGSALPGSRAEQYAANIIGVLNDKFPSAS